MLALKRETAKSKGVGLLPSVLPECKQMLKQPPDLPPAPAHTAISGKGQREKGRAPACHRQRQAAALKTSMHQGSSRKLGRLDFKAET